MYGTGDFCVMKYEAKTGSATVTATTQATGFPQVNISQKNAITACSNAGASLISNAEWMTIARNIEGQNINWFNPATPTINQVGSGGLWRGHSDNNPPNALAASEEDNQGYEGTNNAPTSANGWSGWQERRTHTLSNGEVIWDISGNVWEWLSDTIQQKDQPYSATQTEWGWRQYNSITNFGTLNMDLIEPGKSTWNSSRNVGQLYSHGPNTSTTTFAFLRGGYWLNATGAGVFTLGLSFIPSYTPIYVGFRCVLH